MKHKIHKIMLNNFGEFLGRGRGCITVNNKRNKTYIEYPIFEDLVKEVTIREGSAVSAGALVILTMFDIPTIITNYSNVPIAFLTSIDSMSHIKTRLSQYEAYKSIKGITIAKQIVKSKINGQNQLLQKYNFKIYEPKLLIKSDNLIKARKSFIGTEGKYAQYYYKHIFSLFPEKIRPNRRIGYKAYDGWNNILNYCYQFLKWKIFQSLIKAKLEPYLGFLHSNQFGKPSLVCDFQELYRYLIDGFLLERRLKYHKKDFVLRYEFFESCRNGKRLFIRNIDTKIELIDSLNGFFETKVDVPRIKIGNKQTINALIDEEAQLFASYLRNEREMWIPRLPSLQSISYKPLETYEEYLCSL